MSGSIVRLTLALIGLAAALAVMFGAIDAYGETTKLSVACALLAANLTLLFLSVRAIKRQ